jgi:hypothetical protein
MVFWNRASHLEIHKVSMATYYLLRYNIYYARTETRINEWNHDSGSGLSVEGELKLRNLISYVDSNNQFVGMNYLCSFLSEQYSVADDAKNQV